MRSPSLCILPAVFAASVLTLGSLAHARAPDGGTPDPDSSVAADAASQAQLDDLLTRVRQLETEQDARTTVPEVTPATADTGTAPPIPATDTAPSPFRLGGYAEALYQWNFNNPSNGITNFRGFDNRHNTFTLSSVALDAAWDYQGLVGRLTLQVGRTPSTYYLSEPSAPGASAANASDAELWKYVQQAYAGYRFGVGGGLTVTAGLFLSPIFWPAPWVGSGTATVDYRPHERVSFQLEYRHDHAGADMYFGGNVAGDGGATPFVANRASQDTLTIGATTWF